MLWNLVLAGGRGTRLWPLSRKAYPKQFAQLLGDKSLFQETLERNQKLADAFLVITGKDQAFLAQNQGSSFGCQYLLEPVGRNTAPAIALGCLAIQEDPILFVTPSDHYISELQAYAKAVDRAKSLAQEGYLVTFGIQPTRPETGYGYIQVKGEEVLAFHEKPSLEKAQEFLSEGNFFWNSGMFCFKKSVFLKELKKHSPEILDACQEAFQKVKKENGLFQIPLEYMEKIPSNSIDYALMEKTQNIRMVSCDMGWTDLGSFEALMDIQEKDQNQNAFQGKVYSKDCHSSFISSQRVICAIGLSDFIAVDTKDALLLSKRGRSQEVKELLDQLDSEDSHLKERHPCEMRPWGSFEVLYDGQDFKVKIITVAPGHRLSLQKHFHRQEHWVCIAGEGLVEVDNQKIPFSPGSTAFIPKESVHRLSNTGKENLVIVEVQRGDYFGEDDIVRLEDDYQRI
ncbi:MAG: mannose-1-phosphate guanylyltransferase/mannose-6-phosphate isomerase [Planctomycetota bacterium]|nr:MAG: mannose-1-phosphate guanylyltransferase/mannose-6-phosphate isomerase [Planctomycetota bacterium]